MVHDLEACRACYTNISKMFYNYISREGKNLLLFSIQIQSQFLKINKTGKWEWMKTKDTDSNRDGGWDEDEGVGGEGEVVDWIPSPLSL